MNNTYIIATGLSRKTKTWKNQAVTWDDLVNRLSKTTRTTETVGEFRNLSKSDQDDIKDVGGFVAGKLKKGVRRSGYVESRSMITLDADFADADFCDYVEMFAEYSYIIYSTHKHTPDKPRLRLIVPLSREVSADEYEAASRKLAESIGIDMFDDTTYQPHRLMYWPSTSSDGEYVFRHADQKPLDVDKLLAEYQDWHDVTEWPFSSRTVKNHERLLKKQEDPTVKKGVVGAFCRCYDVPAAIAEFIPDVYIKCDIPDRYTYAEGSTAAGLVLYEGGKFAYSNHATDPAGGQLCNAFDLVRLHKFGVRDEDVKEGTPTVKLPSYQAMQELARNDRAVKLRLFEERTQASREDFAGMIEDGDAEAEEGGNDWAAELDVDSKGAYVSSINNIKLILDNDKSLKGKLGFNCFTGRYAVLGSLPWNDDDSERSWTDPDDSGLRHYVEKVYCIKSKSAIDDARVLVSQDHSYHPVKDYLEGLVWDGVKRAETLFIDYLGADDNIYTRAVTRKILAAAVRRVKHPGVKFDNMLVLVGPQGCGKSHIINRLGGRWFSDTLTTVQGKEAYEELQGFWIIEIAELSAMRKSEIEAVKHFTAKQCDSYRAAYGHHIENHPRQCVFIGTTNRYEFLHDSTGNRRFQPVDVHPENATKDIFADLTDDEVAQIWAEACEIEAAGEALYMDTEELRDLALQEQENHFEESPLAGDIEKYLETLLPENWSELDLPNRRMFLSGSSDEFGVQPKGTVSRTKVCALEIWCEALGGDRRDFTTQKSKEIQDVIMRTGGWERVKTNMRFPLYGHQRGFKRLSCLE